MLRLLRVSGFALIDEVELTFGSGLTVITGETGAGKSILVDALGLLRGGRASAEVIRTGRDEAQVEAIFDVPPTWPMRRRLEAEGRDLSEGLVVRRVVARNGRGRVHLAGVLGTVGELQANVSALVDITSQHDSQSLMDPDSQLDILDGFAGNDDLRARAGAAHEAVVTARAELTAFEGDARSRAEREDFLRYQLRELEEAKLQPGEDVSLKAEREKAKGAEKFLAAASRGEDVLFTGETAAAGLAGIAVRELAPLVALDPALGPLVERIRNAQVELEDVGRDLGRYGAGIRVEPGRLEEIEERLFLVGRLLRKHGGCVEMALARQAELERELAELGAFEDTLASRRVAVATAVAALTEASSALSEKRRKAGKQLGKKIDETLLELGFPDAHVRVVMEARPEAGPTGGDKVTFLFAPNPGEEPRPLGRIASGGELSRVMLAVKRALARADQALLYVFDEIDSGVGGATGEVMGRKLKAIARERQVLAVTHLAQIAAFADQHVRVAKEATKSRTTVRIESLDEAQRAQELTRMVGGAQPSKHAAAHADEMLRRARAGQSGEVQA